MRGNVCWYVEIMTTNRYILAIIVKFGLLACVETSGLRMPPDPRARLVSKKKIVSQILNGRLGRGHVTDKFLFNASGGTRRHARDRAMRDPLPTSSDFYATASLTKRIPSDESLPVSQGMSLAKEITSGG